MHLHHAILLQINYNQVLKRRGYCGSAADRIAFKLEFRRRIRVCADFA